MPMPTTSDAASERACHALATSMLDLTRLATDSMSRNNSSLAISAAPATHNATMWTFCTASGSSSLRKADHNIPTPTANSSAPSIRDAAVSKRWWP